MILAKRLLGASQKGAYVPSSYTTAWKFPSANTIVFTGDHSWINISNAYADDVNDATCANAAGNINETSDSIAFSGFGFTDFDVPVGATITSIDVESEWGQSGTGAEWNRQYRFQSDPVSSPARISQIVENSNPFTTTDSLSAGPSTLLRSDIVSSNFTLRYSILCTQKAAGDFLLNYVKCRINYDY